MLKILDKIVISNYAPKSNNVVWIDTSNGSKIKIMNGSGWQSVGGSSYSDSISQAKKEYYERILDDLAFSQEVQGICNSLTDDELTSLFSDIEALNGLTPKEALFMQVSDAYEIEDGEKHVDFSKLQAIGNDKKVSTPFFDDVAPAQEINLDINPSMFGDNVSPNSLVYLVLYNMDNGISIIEEGIRVEDVAHIDSLIDFFDLEGITTIYGYLTIATDGSGDTRPFGTFTIKTRSTDN